jgi:hypothetical protein
MHVVMGGEGIDLFVYFKIVKIDVLCELVSIKTRDFVPPLTRADGHRRYSYWFPNWQSNNKEAF